MGTIEATSTRRRGDSKETQEQQQEKQQQQQQQEQQQQRVSLKQVLLHEGNRRTLIEFVLWSLLLLLLPLCALWGGYEVLQQQRPEAAASGNMWLAGIGACMVLLLLTVGYALLAVKREYDAAAAAAQTPQDRQRQRRDASNYKYD